MSEESKSRSSSISSVVVSNLNSSRDKEDQKEKKLDDNSNLSDNDIKEKEIVSKFISSILQEELEELEKKIVTNFINSLFSNKQPKN